MRQAYVDANVIVRLITNEPPGMVESAIQLFQHVDDGVLELVVDDIIIAETIWTLSSFYGFSAAEIAPMLATFLVGDGIVSDCKTELLQALALYEDKNIDFIDALLAIRMIKSGVTEVYSFDKHFDRMESIQRLMPGQE